MGPQLQPGQLAVPRAGRAREVEPGEVLEAWGPEFDPKNPLKGGNDSTELSEDRCMYCAQYTCTPTQTRKIHVELDT